MKELNSYIESLGISLYGYADLRSFDPSLHANLPYGIAIGIAIDPDIVRKIPNGPFMDYAEAYKTITARLDEICVDVANQIKKLGYNAIPQDRKYVDQQTRIYLGNPVVTEEDAIPGKALMPHKTVVATAGLGWITKSALVATKEFGSAIRFTSILTDAPVDAVAAEYHCLCGNCRICADACPAKAIYGKLWEPGVEREELFDYDACERGHDERAEILGINQGGTCGVCIAVCPHTKRYTDQSISK